MMRFIVIVTFVCAGIQALDAQSANQRAQPQVSSRNPSAAVPGPAPAPEKAGMRLSFEGVTKFDEKKLREALADYIEGLNQESLTPARADDTAFFLGVFYRNHGYSQVDVKYEILTGGRLLLRVSEGPFTTIGKVTFRGNAHVEDDKLRDYLVGTTRERFPRLKREIPYVEADVETGVDLIRGHYASEGYLDSTVTLEETTFSSDKTAALITVTVDEGIQYHFGEITFTGDLVFGRSADLMKQIEPFRKEPYTEGRVALMQRAVVYFYKRRGYFQVKVSAESDPANAHGGMVPVSFRADSGELYRFDGVSVEGLDRLRPGFLQRRFGKLEGSIYDPTKVDDIFKEMMRTGLFKKLRIDLRALPSNEVELHMEVEEAPSRELGFFLGYGTFEGPFIGFSLGSRDLFGTGRSLRGSAEFSTSYLKGEVLFSDPWFLETDYSLQARLFALTQDFDGYSKAEVGFRPSISHKIGKHAEATLFGLARQVEITNDGIDPVEIGLSSYLVNSVGASITLDYRDSPINPGRGWVGTASADYAANALGSDLDFVRTTWRFSYYLPIRETLLAFGTRGGLIFPLSTTEIPIDERFFNGGSRSVRSYPERELGPKDSHGYPIGGETFSTFNIEYVFPIFGDLQGAVFVDAGSTGLQYENWPGTLKYGIGCGLRYKLPIGPIRLDYGYNPSPGDGDPSGAFHFSFGFAF
jgi:outer membrane protein assembly complex protein YaeT